MQVLGSLQARSRRTLFLENKLFSAILILGAAHALAGYSFGQGHTATPEKRPVIVADTIRMARIAGKGYYPPWVPKGGFAVFSPDGKRFAIVITQGNGEKNTKK